MISGIITLLSLLGFLAVVVYVFVLKSKKDFDEQARMPLEDGNERPGHPRGDHPDQTENPEQTENKENGS